MLIVELLVVAALVLVNGLFAMSELAIVSSRPARLRAMIDRGAHGSRRALALHNDPGRFLSTVQVGITLVGIIAGAFSGTAFGSRLGAWLGALGLAQGIAEPIAYAVVVGTITYLSVVVGELVPKQIALRQPEKIACFVAPLMSVIARVAAPFVWLLDVSGKALLAAMGRSAEPQAHVTDEEVKTIIAEAETAGVLEPEERRMITGVMRLGDRPVRAIMTPRHDVDMIDLDNDRQVIKAAIKASGHSRLPVFEGSPDKVVGVIQAKDLLDALLAGNDPDPRRVVRAAPVIPETNDALDVVAALRRSPVHIGLVHDEYGHFTGIVTMADILESIAGAFHTEAGQPEPHFVRRADGSYLLSGSMPVDELADLLGIPVADGREYHTVAGFALHGFGRIPEIADTFNHHGWQFEVVDIDGRRIDKVLASRLPAVRRAL